MHMAMIHTKHSKEFKRMVGDPSPFLHRTVSGLITIVTANSMRVEFLMMLPMTLTNGIGHAMGKSMETSWRGSNHV